MATAARGELIVVKRAGRVGGEALGFDSADGNRTPSGRVRLVRASKSS